MTEAQVKGQQSYLLLSNLKIRFISTYKLPHLIPAPLSEPPYQPHGEESQGSRSNLTTTPFAANTGFLRRASQAAWAWQR